MGTAKDGGDMAGVKGQHIDIHFTAFGQKMRCV